MSDKLPPSRNLESLKKESKRWLAAIRAGDGDARARLLRAVQEPPREPTLRDVQHALAREHGFDGWNALKEAIAQGATPNRSGRGSTLADYEVKAAALLDAYRTGTPEAMARHYQHTWHRRAWPAMRRYVQLDLGKRPTTPDDVDISVDEARYLIAVEHGFAGWPALTSFVASRQSTRHLASKPVAVVTGESPRDARVIASSRDWDEVRRLLASNPSAGVAARGEMTDEVLDQLSRVETIAALHLGGSKALTDGGVRHLARLPALKHLDLSGTAITDVALEVLRHLPAIETVSLAGTRITDAGAIHLASCEALQHVDLSWTRTGDGALRTLAGKQNLRYVFSGNTVTDAGVTALQEMPAIKTWQGGEPRVALLDINAGPTYVALRGSFTDRGLGRLVGLDGLFALNLWSNQLAITPAGLAPLVDMTHLGWLAFEATNESMPYIARLPRLRFLMCQDTVADDQGFAALSESRSIEYIWGRRCHNLRTRGFLALAEMPALRGLSVSCLNVEDAGIAALPRFPALTELMPMDVPDAGYRHIGKCERLESLVLMYCRDTTDAATEHITGLRHLTSYFNSYTTITDRTPERLSTVESLERVTFDTCHALTNAGVARLARLPRLRELRVSGRGITPDVVAAFPPQVSVSAAAD